MSLDIMPTYWHAPPAWISVLLPLCSLQTNMGVFWRGRCFPLGCPCNLMRVCVCVCFGRGGVSATFTSSERRKLRHTVQGGRAKIPPKHQHTQTHAQALNMTWLAYQTTAVISDWWTTSLVSQEFQAVIGSHTICLWISIINEIKCGFWTDFMHYHLM